MEYLTIIGLVGLILYVWRSNKITNEKINAVSRDHLALFWTLKKKNLFDINELKEGQKIARGEKNSPMSLKDFIDLKSK